MIRSLIRNICIYALSLFVLPYIISGVKIQGGYFTLAVGSITLTVLFSIVKPILSVLTFPFNLFTLGLFSIFTNAFLVYLLTKFVPNIMITGFAFKGTSLVGFAIPAMHINTFFAFVLAGIVISIISGIGKWIVRD